MSRLHNWVPVRREIDFCVYFYADQHQHKRIYYATLRPFLRYRSGVPHMRKPIADALLIWNRGGFGEMSPAQFITSVLEPTDDACKLQKVATMRAARKDHKQRRRALREATAP